MKLTLMCKLLPDADQARLLDETMAVFNTACNYVSAHVHILGTVSKFRIQKVVYYDVRSRFGLSAQMTLLVIRKVAEVYKRDRSRLHRFRSDGAIIYDSRILSWKRADRVSLLVLAGRITIPILTGARQRPVRPKGQADLVKRDGMYFLYQTIDIPTPPEDKVDDYLGVDLGIINLATDSDGTHHTGKQVNGLRRRHVRLRSRLQKKGTSSAKRLLKTRRRKEQRFARDVNHVISKQVVAKAKGTGRGIALEDLTGIRDRITVRTAQRRIHHSWAFAQLRAFIEYKARLVGVPVILVDPRNTSRTCPACGHCAKANRKTQARFSCVKCGVTGPADCIAAENIRRAVINRPHVDAPSRSESQTPPRATG